MFIAVFGALLGLSALLTRALGNVRVPAVLLFLGIGMLAGSEGIGGIYFADYDTAFRIGLVALAMILFDGGLNTPTTRIKQYLLPAGVLATVGVALTAGLVGLVARVIGFSWLEAMLLGAIVSSTDAAAVFSVLRSSGLHLKRRVGTTLELESGLNDPMAVLLTLELTRLLLQPGDLGWVRLVASLVLQLGIGAATGLLFGYGGRWILQRIRPFTGGLFPVVTLSIACISFGVPTIINGSGFLSVYIAGVVLGNGRLPYRAGLLRVHDFLAWLSQVVMFLTLGLLVFPSQLPAIALGGLAVAGFLVFVARPLAVSLCLLPFRYPPREIAFIGWVGLRGAVPIILAIFPIMAGVDDGMRIFNVVFFVVVVSALVQGGSVRRVTSFAGLQVKTPPPAPAAIEITSTNLLSGDVMTFYIDRVSAVCGAQIAEVPFPPESAVMLVIRERALIAPKGATLLREGDHVYVFSRPEDQGTLRLLFGRQEED